MILSANAPASRAAIFDVAAPDDATFMYFTLPLHKRNNFTTSAPTGIFLVIKTIKFVKLLKELCLNANSRLWHVCIWVTWRARAPPTMSYSGNLGLRNAEFELDWTGCTQNPAGFIKWSKPNDQGMWCPIPRSEWGWTSTAAACIPTVHLLGSQIRNYINLGLQT